MPKTVLHYFNVKGLGESVRLMLAYGGQEFEDNRVELEDWESVRPSTPFGELPVLEIDGKKYAQSNAIARYLGKKFNLNGANIEEEFEIDQNVDFLTGIRTDGVEVHFETDENVRATKHEEYTKNKYPFQLKKLDEIITRNNGYFAAGKLTWADFIFAGNFEYLKVLLRMPDLEKQYPSFKQVIDKVYGDSKVKEYSIKSPETEY